MLDFQRLDDKAVFLTGAADGIGAALAAGFAAGGARVFISDIAGDKLAERARELNAASAVCDVTDEKAVAEAFGRAWDEVGPIDVLCANAGVFQAGSILDASARDLAWLFAVNVGGIVHAARPFVARLRETGRIGHILMTGSENSLSLPAFLHGMPAHIYNMTKHAVLALGDCLRAELEPEGIGVSVLCPGPVATDLPMNSAEFRPDRFGGATTFALDASGVDPKAAEFLGSVTMPPDEAAAIALEGLRRGLFIIPTHAYELDDARARFADIERGFQVLEGLG